MNSGKFPDTSSYPPAPPAPQRKEGESATVRRELDQIARQLKGLSDRVKRLKESTA